MPPYETLSYETMRFGTASNVGRVRYIGDTRCVPLCFKFATTRETKVYNIPTGWHIRTMILNVQTWAKRDFPGLTAVQEGDIGVFVVTGESATQLEEENISVKQKFENMYGIISFCVRPIVQVSLCSICLEERPSGCYFQCAHLICRDCNDSCVAAGHNTCPECRGHRII